MVFRRPVLIKRSHTENCTQCMLSEVSKASLGSAMMRTISQVLVTTNHIYIGGVYIIAG